MTGGSSTVGLVAFEDRGVGPARGGLALAGVRMVQLKSGSRRCLAIQARASRQHPHVDGEEGDAVGAEPSSASTRGLFGPRRRRPPAGAELWLPITSPRGTVGASRPSVGNERRIE